MDHQWSLSHKICARINWREVYADFKSHDLSINEYRTEVFIDFLKRHGITNYVPKDITLRRHFKAIREQEETEAIAQKSESETSENKAISEIAENRTDDCHGSVNVFLLNDINDALSHRDDHISKQPTKPDVAQPSPLFPPPQNSVNNEYRVQEGRRILEATWHGAVFKIPCINPEESLARLLVKLKVFEEKSNAHQL